MAKANPDACAIIGKAWSGDEERSSRRMEELSKIDGRWVWCKLERRRGDARVVLAWQG